MNRQQPIGCILMGGLGNQLFQIFTTIAHAVKHNRPFVFSSTKAEGTQHLGFPRPTYWDNFLKQLSGNTTSIAVLQAIRNVEGLRYIETQHEYIEIPPPLKDKPQILTGYFESYKYFEPYFVAIYNMLKLDVTREKSIKILSPYRPATIISLHMRRGDFVVQTNRGYHRLLDDKYYIDAVKILLSKINKPKKEILIMCFTEPTDTQYRDDFIIKAKKELDINCMPPPPTIATDYDELMTMSSCDHHVISASTFSWWAAYINKSPNKLVVYPTPWFGPKNNHLDTSSKCPDSWISLKC